MSIQNAYNNWSEIYDTNLNKTRDLDQQVTNKTLSKLTFENVLELGCGTGKNTEWLVQKATQVVAVDFSQGMLDIAISKIKSKNVRFLQADITKNWDFNTEIFDLITCSLILEHIENLDFIFAQAFQKLERGGKFFICELHPFKQYLGSKARFETEIGVEELDVYIHHMSEFVVNAQKNEFKILELSEWFDDPNISGIPRLISFVFERI
jgi:ubiquinone/menaquinone biosynthesis C-methylase UbiE